MNNIKKIRLIRNIIVIGIIALGIIAYLIIINIHCSEKQNNNNLESFPMEIYNYNETVERYIGENIIGENVKGTDIKRMIEDIISHNCQYVNESGKFISIHNGEYDKESKSRLVDGKRVELFENDEELDEACKMANIYENKKYGENTQENIDKATDKMREFAKKISAGKKYKVEAVKENEVIFAVYISPVE